jgi:nucleoside-diphosphate-sugar epimerase
MNPLSDDLDHILDHTEGLWEEIRGRKIFITGGTGFFGCWLLESLLWADQQLELNLQAVVLTRNAEAFQRRAPRLAAHRAVYLYPGDVRSFAFPEGEFSHVIHAATESGSSLNREDPSSMLDTIIGGTRRTLDFAVRCKARKFLLTSSGAVYGRQPPELSHVPEDYPGAPDPTDPRSAYAEGKRIAELLCSLYRKDHGLEAKIARCFAFVGPYLPLDVHFAIGNFIRDGIGGGPIRVNGDGTPQRSYLYAADLMIWLWSILFRGRACTPYNTGSEAGLSIAELAQTVAGIFQPQPDVVIAKAADPANTPERYVPCTKRVREELSLAQWVDLPEAIRRTGRWHLSGEAGDASPHNAQRRA